MNRVTGPSWAPLLACLVGLCAGCIDQANEPITLPAWRQAVERYVWEQGNGDPNVLADMSWDDVHHGFALIGDALPDRSTDLLGLLVAHRPIAGRPCFIFLVGTVRQKKLLDLHPVALDVQDGEFHWSVGKDDPAARTAYRQWSDSSRRAAMPADPDPPTFPRPEDSFSVSIYGTDAEILHGQTAARWRLRIAPFPASQPGRAAQSNSSSSATRPSK